MQGGVTEPAATDDLTQPKHRSGTILPMREQIRRRGAAAAIPGALWTARGYKPAYLWDANEPTERAVAECLRHCRAKSDGVVKALQLGRDVLLCNVAESQRRLAHCRHAVKFVDVSAQLRSPAVLTSLPAGVDGMLASLELILAQMATLPPESGATVPADYPCAVWNLCTAFGVLLGYPVVYWFDGGADAANCLAMEELNVVRVRSARQGDPTEKAGCHEVYSFSFPLRLSAELGPHVDAWWKELSSKARDLSRVDEVRCYPVVAL